jgi:hypothetical protein
LPASAFGESFCCRMLRNVTWRTHIKCLDLWSVHRTSRHSFLHLILFFSFCFSLPLRGPSCPASIHFALLCFALLALLCSALLCLALLCFALLCLLCWSAHLITAHLTTLGHPLANLLFYFGFLW